MIARHYHQPTGQWVGPHSRAYSPVVDSLFSGMLYEASGGRAGSPSFTGDVKMTHKIPTYLLHYFISPNYPRTESDEFIVSDPKVTGTAFMTSKYALATANRSSMWNQRHPLLVYWGTVQHPQYCQLRFLHDFLISVRQVFIVHKTKTKYLRALTLLPMVEINISALIGSKKVNSRRAI